MAKQTKAEKVTKWMKQHGIGGDNPWWDKSKTYYNVTAEQIVRIATFLKRDDNQ